MNKSLFSFAAHIEAVACLVRLDKIPFWQKANSRQKLNNKTLYTKEIKEIKEASTTQFWHAFIHQLVWNQANTKRLSIQ